MKNQIFAKFYLWVEIMIDKGVIDFCEEIIDYVSRRYNESRDNICIAGGFLRDFHFNVVPKDIDIYFMGQPVTNNSGYDPDGQFKVFENFEYLGFPAQIIHTQFANVKNLLDSFDWEICNFAYHSYGCSVLRTPTVTFGAGFPISYISGDVPHRNWSDCFNYSWKPHLLGLNNYSPKSLNQIITTINRGIYLKKKLDIPIHDKAWEILNMYFIRFLKRMGEKTA